MTVPSQMSVRRIPEALHLKVRVAYAAAWEALVGTHTDEALQFVCEFASRLPVLEGLDLYLHVTAIPEAMQETVRFRTLTALDLESLPALTELPALSGWKLLRIDLLLEQQRYRHRYHEKTLELARMVGARAAEAIVATHVENAIGFAQLLKGAMPVNAATDRYLREFGLPANVAQMVMQRVQARVAGEELTAQYEELPPQPLEPVSPPRRSDGMPAVPASADPAGGAPVSAPTPTVSPVAPPPSAPVFPGAKALFR
jgi:hypothetical protein